MKKILIFSLAAFAFVSGCSKKTVASTEMKGSVAMVLSGLKTDEAFNQYTYEGMMRATKERGIKTAYREEVSQDEQIEIIRQFELRPLRDRGRAGVDGGLGASPDGDGGVTAA